MSGREKLPLVLAIYRRMLRLSKRLPAAERGPALVQIRAAFRDNASETRADKVAELIRVAQQKLGYIRIVTPREPGDDTESGGGVSRYVIHDGKLVSASTVDAQITNPGGADATREWVDPALLARHEAGMRRFRFLDRR